MKTISSAGITGDNFIGTDLLGYPFNRKYPPDTKRYGTHYSGYRTAQQETFFYDRILGEVIIPRLSSKQIGLVAQWILKFKDKCPFLCARVAIELQGGRVGEQLAMDVAASFAAEDTYLIKNGFRAFFNWCSIAKNKGLSFPVNILRDAVNVVAMRDGDAFFSACENLGKLVHCVPFPEEIEQPLLLQLDKLVTLTTYDNPSGRFNNEDRGDYRASAANLANQIYKEFLSTRRNIPPAIIKWKEICMSNNELASVRQMWSEPQQSVR